MLEIAIRPLSPADQDDWAAMRHALWPHHPIGELAAELAGMLAAGTFVGFGAFDNDRIIGFAEASERPCGDGCDTAPVAWLEGIFVRHAYRRTGIARRLVAAVEAWARIRDLSELGSDAALDNLPSRLSHVLWGFKETERVVMFRKALI